MWNLSSETKRVQRSTPDWSKSFSRSIFQCQEFVGVDPAELGSNVGFCGVSKGLARLESNARLVGE